jgi:DNA-binding CsgD family transcriptional regulator
MIIKKRYVEIETPNESEYMSISKDIDIPLYIDDSPILKDIASRLGKMRIQDIAHDLNTNISIVKKHRKEILSKLSEVQRVTIICQEQKIEKLRKKILAGEMERRPHNYTFGVEGLVRGIIRDLTTQGKSIREIVEQTHLETSTISYHRKKIKDGERRKYPPRIMNMTPNKKGKVKRLLKENKRQTDICEILDISSATASVIVNKIKNDIDKN